MHAGWVLDADVFNEWMNEEDYCVDERNVPVVLRQRIHLRDDQVAANTAKLSVLFLHQSSRLKGLVCKFF